MTDDSEKKKKRRKRLRKGFSTGTAATAAAQAALRFLLTGAVSRHVSVRLPAGYFLPVPIDRIEQEGRGAVAFVIKDGGDDPDVTHKGEIAAAVDLDCFQGALEETNSSPCCAETRVRAFQSLSGVVLRGGPGVGHVTKRGLPVPPGEPAINPVPRGMMAENLYEELLRVNLPWGRGQKGSMGPQALDKASVFLPFPSNGFLPGDHCLRVNVEVRVPKGEEMALRTLNPRLGVKGGISILGTTGLVKPFSHKAYEETIEAGLSVAAAAGCHSVVLSTGGKSEKFARELLAHLPVECFVEIADFFAFGVQESVRVGFRRIVHSVFFGKAVKMAQGHPYTHAHRVALDLEPLSRLVLEKGHEKDFSRKIAQCNTARHALELIQERSALNVVEDVAREARDRSRHFAGHGTEVRVLLFDYGGLLLADTEGGSPWA